jgi:ATP-binding cassette subfamily B protein
MLQNRSPLNRLWQYLKPKRKKIILASVFSVFNKLFDLAPPALIGFAIDVVVNGEASFLAGMGFPDPRLQLIILAVITALVWVFESLFEYLFSVAWKNLAQQTQHDLRMDAYRHLQKQRFAYFEDKSTGQLITILNDDVNQLERFLDVGANDIIQVLTTIAVIGGMYLIIAPGVGWIAVLPIPVIIWASVWFQKFLEPRYRKVRDAAGEISGQLANNIQGMATIKSYGTENLENARISGLSDSYRLANVSTIKLSSAFIPMIRMIILSSFIAIMLMAGFQALDGALAVGLYSMMIYIVQRLLWPLTRLGQTFDLYQRAMASANRIMGLLDVEEHLSDGDVPLPEESARGHFLINDVSFAYASGETVLDRLNLEIEPGWTAGIVGATGAGKTSLIKLLLRLYDVSDGSIALDGKDLREYRLADLARSIALVSQDVFLFHGSVKENIAYGSPGASDEQIEEAARLAEAHEFIMSFRNGYDTVVGERGKKLSGGQRQRISIARALLKDAPILILDEATSSVDNETEAAIQKSLAKIAHSRTTIVIAHRLSTIRHADRIFVLSGGRLAEDGTHEELIAAGGIYEALWRVQSGEAALQK